MKCNDDKILLLFTLLTIARNHPNLEVIFSKRKINVDWRKLGMQNCQKGWQQHCTKNTPIVLHYFWHFGKYFQIFSLKGSKALTSRQKKLTLLFYPIKIISPTPLTITPKINSAERRRGSLFLCQIISKYLLTHMGVK